MTNDATKLTIQLEVSKDMDLLTILRGIMDWELPDIIKRVVICADGEIAIDETWDAMLRRLIGE